MNLTACDLDIRSIYTDDGAFAHLTNSPWIVVHLTLTYCTYPYFFSPFDRTGTIQDTQSRCSDAVEAIASSAITDNVRAAILSTMEEVFGADFEHSCVAVRSSASGMNF